MKDKYDVFNEGETVYVRPRLVDEPMKAEYLHRVSEERRKEGYRDGHIVLLEDGKEVWVRWDLCGYTKEQIENIKA